MLKAALSIGITYFANLNSVVTSDSKIILHYKKELHVDNSSVRKNEDSGTQSTLVENEDGDKHLNTYHEDQILYFERTKIKTTV